MKNTNYESCPPITGLPFTPQMTLSFYTLTVDSAAPCLSSAMAEITFVSYRKQFNRKRFIPTEEVFNGADVMLRSQAV